MAKSREETLQCALDKAMCNRFTGREGRTRFSFGDAFAELEQRTGRSWEDIFSHGSASRDRPS